MKWASVARSPALVVLPPAAVSLAEANLAIEQWQHYRGRELDPEQRLSVQMMMAEAKDGLWAARTTARAESRQNGKGDEIEVVESFGLVHRHEAILHTTHEIPTGRRAHLRIVELFESHKDLRKLIKKILYADGRQELQLTTGGMIAYRTRTDSGGRGLDDMSRLVVDEAQHAKPEQLASTTPILAVAPNPQTNFLGSGGILNRSAWWWSQRFRALRVDAGLDDAGRFSHLEHSAEVVTLDDNEEPVQVAPDPYDREAWARANPAYPHRITDEYLAEQLEILGPELFAREHLCVWDPPPAPAKGEAPVDFDQWMDRKHRQSKPVGGVVLGVDTGFDQERAAIGASGRRSDGRTHLEVIDEQRGYRWIESRLEDLLADHDVRAVGVDSTGPARALLPAVRRVCKAAEVEVVALPGPAYQGGCSSLVSSVKADDIRHGGDALLADQIATARKRKVGDGWVWDRRYGDISALGAVTSAFAALQGVDTAPKEGSTSAYDDHDFMTV